MTLTIFMKFVCGDSFLVYFPKKHRVMLGLPDTLPGKKTRNNYITSLSILAIARKENKKQIQLKSLLMIEASIEKK